MKSRSLRVLGVIAGIAMTLLAVAPAQAENSDPNWWYAGMRVDNARAEGLTGAGVKIGVVDGFINPDLPLFAGAKLTVSAALSCDTAPSPATQRFDGDMGHGTEVTALLLARPTGEFPIQGIAPDASVTFYSDGEGGCATGRDGRSALMEGVKRAIDDGNQIVSIASGQGLSGEADQKVIANAMAKGVVIVSSSPNDASEYSLVVPQQYNGVVSVAAVGSDGKLLTEDDGVTPVVTPSITVVAPGVDVRVPGSRNGWDRSSLGDGSSYATPLVAGSLALLSQKYPSATGNQLVQALISTTAQAKAGKPRDQVNGYGYGAVSLRNLLAADPTKLPDVSPLMDKPLGVPTASEVAVAGGKALPSPSASKSPTTKSPSATEPAPVTREPAVEPSNPVMAALPWIIGGGVAVLIVLAALLVVILLLVKRSRRSTQP